jgi:hypothetical protein
MWVVENGAELTATLEPAQAGEHQMRTVTDGTLDYLKSAYNLEAIEAHVDLENRIAAAKGKARSRSGRSRPIASATANRQPCAPRSAGGKPIERSTIQLNVGHRLQERLTASW